MDSITVYEHANYQGLQKTFTADVPNLLNEYFNDCISSVKIVGQPWVLYEHPNYQGWCLALEEGEYSKLSRNDKVSSLKLISEDLSNPEITVYEHINAGGKEVVLTEETNLTFGTINDTISSHRVQSGAWLLYEHPKRGGKYIVARAGEYLAKYSNIGFNDKVSHVYPLQAGTSSVTATILWDKKKVEHVRNIHIDDYSFTNDTSIEQQFTATSTKEFEKYVSHRFEFSNETAVKVGTSITLLDVITINAEVSNTFTVTKGKSESSTTRKKAELSLPVIAPPRTTLTVIVMCKEVTISVPVELKIVQGSKTDFETAAYHCTSGTEIYIDLQSFPIN